MCWRLRRVQGQLQGQLQSQLQGQPQRPLLAWPRSLRARNWQLPHLARGAATRERVLPGTAVRTTLREHRWLMLTTVAARARVLRLSPTRAVGC